MSKKEFENFIAHQKRRESETAKVDWNAVREKWFIALSDLYAEVQKLIQKYIAAGDIIVTRKKTTLFEENLGRYECESLVLRIGAQELTFNPIGTIIFGAHGRVDLVGPRGQAKFVFVPRKSSGSRLQVTVLNPNEEKPAPVPVETDFRWKIVAADTNMNFLELTEESLMDVILEVANG